MTRPIEALVHTDALAANLARARVAGAGAKVWAVVKANAYGHGIAQAYAGLRGADGFALLDIAEAELLRELGWRGPILLLEGCFGARDLEACSRLDLWHVVHHTAQIDMLAAHKTQAPQRVFLKMNSGMNRLGFMPHSYRAAWLRLDALPQVESIVLMTHLAGADGAGVGDGSEGHSLPADVRAQMAVFESATSELPGERSICNSAAALRFATTQPAIRGDWIRPGIMLYGGSPDDPRHTAAEWGLLPTMSLRSRLIACQDLVAGDTIGYGGAYRVRHAMRIGVVACGYADGYPRVVPTSNLGAGAGAGVDVDADASTENATATVAATAKATAAADAGTAVLVDGVRTRIVGRVSMDMITVDLTALPTAHVGSEVTLWGRAGNGAVLPIDEIARAAGTVGYELMCARAPRVPVRAVA